MVLAKGRMNVSEVAVRQSAARSSTTDKNPGNSGTRGRDFDRRLVGLLLLLLRQAARSSDCEQ